MVASTFITEDSVYHMDNNGSSLIRFYNGKIHDHLSWIISVSKQHCDTGIFTLLVMQLISGSNGMFVNMLALFSMLPGIDVSYKTEKTLFL
ncbi:MAG: hypothetical protein ACP5OC_08895 [Thermoplasmata archaeon]